jgi:hypothetical protein
LAVRPDAINRTRTASEASRKGISVARPLKTTNKKGFKA